MKQQFVVIHRHTTLQETEKLDRSLTDQNVSTSRFGENIRRSNFFVDTTF